MGQNSEVQWLSSVQRQTEDIEKEPLDQPYGPPGSSAEAISARSSALHERRNYASEHGRRVSTRYITDSTFYLDSDELKFDIIVDPYEDPEPDIAERLFSCYMDTVHPSFPLVSRPLNVVTAF